MWNYNSNSAFLILKHKLRIFSLHQKSHHHVLTAMSGDSKWSYGRKTSQCEHENIFVFIYFIEILLNCCRSLCLCKCKLVFHVHTKKLVQQEMTVICYTVRKSSGNPTGQSHLPRSKWLPIFLLHFCAPSQSCCISLLVICPHSLTVLSTWKDFF